MRKYICEFMGTAILLLFGCGSATVASNFVGALGIAIAFGLAYLITAFIIGNISGCHLNPAISLAKFLIKKLSFKDLIYYIIAQLLGALVGCILLTFIITSANIGSIENIGLAANGFGTSSSVNLSITGAFLSEIVLTLIFVLIFLQATKNKDANWYIISLALCLIHILGIPLTGTSVNPARSLAPALLLKGTALRQVWLFIIAPFIGSILATLIFKYALNEKK